MGSKKDTAIFLDAIIELEKEKGIKREELFERLKAGLLVAYKKDFNDHENISVDITEKGVVKMYSEKTVIDNICEVEGVTGADISTAILKAVIDVVCQKTLCVTYELLYSTLEEIIKAKKAVNDNYEITTRKVSKEYALSQINKGEKKDGIIKQD